MITVKHIDNGITVHSPHWIGQSTQECHDAFWYVAGFREPHYPVPATSENCFTFDPIQGKSGQIYCYRHTLENKAFS